MSKGRREDSPTDTDTSSLMTSLFLPVPFQFSQATFPPIGSFKSHQPRVLDRIQQKACYC